MLLGWAVVSSQLAGGDARPLLLLGGASAAVLAVARVVTNRVPALVPAAIVTAALTLAAFDPGALLAGPLGGPFGYANAAAAFFVLAAGAAALLAVRARSPWTRVFALVAALAFAAVPFLNGSLAGAALVLLLPLALVSAAGDAGIRTVIAGGAVLVALVLGSTLAIAATYDDAFPGQPGGQLVDATLTERRAMLWHEALVIMGQNPLTGVGPGRFAEVSPTARADADAAWAHHAYLQLGAELGLVGMVTAVALVAWAFTRLGLGPRDAGTAVVALALTAVATHAAIDYVLHTPAVVLAAAALAGAGPAPAAERQASAAVGVW